MNALPLGVVFATLVANAAHTQTVSTSFAAATPLVASVNIGGVPIQSSAPSGSLPSNGVVTAWNGLVASNIAWGVSGAGGTQTAMLRHLLDAQLTPASTLTATSEIVVTFTATGSAPAYLDFHGSWSGIGNIQMPLVSVDIGNDGTFELFNYLATMTSFPVAVPPLGPGGLAVRVVMSSQLNGPAVLATNFDVAVVPVNNLAIHQTAVACSVGALEMLPPQPAFANLGVDVTAWSVGSTLGLFVIGFSQQPVLLPPFAGLTCVLIPTPDIVLWQPSNVLHIPLPAAARPLAFDVQGVAVTATGLAVSNGYRVAAN